MSILPETLQTTCAYCGVGCGITATVKDAAARLIRIDGDIRHPANAGRLCSKGTALAETLDTHARLLRPRVHGKDAFWNDALDTVAAKLAQVLRESGPDAIAFYVSGQLLTEDYYVANKFAKGFIGTPHIDTNSRLCMASTVVAQQRAFGEDAVPGCYDDLDQADLVILTGSNAAWCHPVLFQRLRAAKVKRGTRVVVIDPRYTATASIADLHLPILAGSDSALFNGLLAWLADHNKLDTLYIDDHTRDFAITLATARADAGTLEQLATRCGVTEKALATFFHWFTTTDRTVTCWSQGVNQSSGGSDKVNAIINCHLATGRIGKPGSSPLSFTGQPNAMGGREVGGLSTQLAAHRLIEDENARDCVAQFWNTTALPMQRGLKAIDLFDAVAQQRIRFLWIMGTNPAVSMPDAGRVRDAIAQCEFVVVSDCVKDTDTLRHAHVALPAQAWGEKNGTVTNSERCISRQRALLTPAGEARPDWWALAQIARRLGFVRAFNWEHPGEIFREHAQLSALANPVDSGRQFNLGAVAHMNTDDYETMAPFQWPWRAGETPKIRLFADGAFAHTDGKARFIPIAAHLPAHATNEQFPLVLNTGRLRDQWHTMTRTGEVARLNRHDEHPFVAIHPDDAAHANLTNGGWARVHTAYGLAVLPVQLTPDQKPGSIFAPMHWTRTNSAGGIVGALPNPSVDPHSGQPELKHTPARIERVTIAAQATVFSVMPLSVPENSFAVLTRIRHGWRLDVSVTDAPPSLTTWLQALCPATLLIETPQQKTPADSWQHASVHYAAAVLCEQKGQVQLVAVANSMEEGNRMGEGHSGQRYGIASAEKLFTARQLDDQLRTQLFSLQAETRSSALVCACLEVDVDTLHREARHCNSLQALCEQTRAGTRCGSCLPELEQFVLQNHDRPTGTTDSETELMHQKTADPTNR